jgi:KEOPS complex subunit Pcc1
MVTGAKCKISFPNKRYLETVFKVLKPEVNKPATMRSKASLEKKDKFLVLTVEARDTVALRAALNAYLRWINSATKVLEVLENA